MMNKFTLLTLFLLQSLYLVPLQAQVPSDGMVESNQKYMQDERTETTSPGPCLVEVTTDSGTMIIQLYDATPKHRDNFLKLVEEGFYNGLLFHRVIRNFMIQGGDPESRGAAPDKPLGMGGPGYTVDAEFVDSLVHVKGALAAARTGDQVNPQRASSGSQFYIVQGQPFQDSMLDQFERMSGKKYTEAQREQYRTLGGTPHLDGQYTVFGKVIQGLEVIDKIANAPTRRGDRPLNDIHMSMRVIHPEK